MSPRSYDRVVFPQVRWLVDLTGRTHFTFHQADVYQPRGSNAATGEAP
jgi:hypothetical protein